MSGDSSVSATNPTQEVLQGFAHMFYAQLPAPPVEPVPKEAISKEEYEAKMLAVAAARAEEEKENQRYFEAYAGRIQEYAAVLSPVSKAGKDFPAFREFVQGLYADEVDNWLTRKQGLDAAPLPAYVEYCKQIEAENTGALRDYLNQRDKWRSTFEECVRLYQEVGLPHEVFMVHVNWAGVAYVKTLPYFVEQGGTTKEWGEAWYPVLARSLEHARSNALIKTAAAKAASK